MDGDHPAPGSILETFLMAAVPTEISDHRDAPPRARHPDVLMRPERLAALQPSRLSMTRRFMRQAVDERWDIQRLAFDIDGQSRGTAHYRIDANGMPLDFVL